MKSSEDCREEVLDSCAPEDSVEAVQDHEAGLCTGVDLHSVTLGLETPLAFRDLIVLFPTSISSPYLIFFHSSDLSLSVLCLSLSLPPVTALPVPIPYLGVALSDASAAGRSHQQQQQ